MLFHSIALALFASTGLVESVSAGRHLDIHRRATGTTGDDTSLTLAQNAIASGSFSDGLTEIGGNEAFEAASATSKNNFINFCAGETLTNGLQIVTGSCNGIRKCLPISKLISTHFPFSNGSNSRERQNDVIDNYIPFSWQQHYTIRHNIQYYYPNVQHYSRFLFQCGFHLFLRSTAARLIRSKSSHLTPPDVQLISKLIIVLLIFPCF